MLTRKAFLRNSVIAAAGLPLFGCGSDETTEAPTTAANPENTMTTNQKVPYLDTIGLQLWSVRDQMELDPTVTLKTLADIGYRQVELMDSRDAAKLVPIAKEYGLEVNSSFLNWNTITGGWKYTPDDTPFEFMEAIDQVGTAGISTLVFGYLRPEERTTLDDWKKLADKLNEAGRVAKENGIQLAYHNHNFEWDPVEGTTGWAVLNERMDGELVPFELDVFWAEIAGENAKETLTSIKDRVHLLHLKQLNPKAAKATRLEDVDPTAFEELPEGNIPIIDLMRYGKDFGVKYCMVEQDGNYAGSSLTSVTKSIEFLQSAS